MQAKLRSRPDLLLLLSLLLAILLTPVLDHGNWGRLVLAAVTFIPVVLSIVRLSQIKGSVWPSVLLALGNVIFVVAGNTFRSQTLTGIRWGFLAAFFALTAAGLFSYLRNSRSVAQAQLYTAINIYLLLGLLWATLYLTMDAFSQGSIQVGSHPADRQTELLYFSLITLSTIGYGDIVPLSASRRRGDHAKGCAQFLIHPKLSGNSIGKRSTVEIFRSPDHPTDGQACRHGV
jgi:hypothetical protein